MDNLRWRSCFSWLDGQKVLKWEFYSHLEGLWELHLHTPYCQCLLFLLVPLSRQPHILFPDITSILGTKIRIFSIKYAKCFSKWILAFFAHTIYTLTRFFTAVKCTLTPGTRRARFPIKASNTKENFFKSSRSMKPQLFWGEIKSSVIMFDIQKFEIFKQEKFTHSFKNKL